MKGDNFSPKKMPDIQKISLPRQDAEIDFKNKAVDGTLKKSVVFPAKRKQKFKISKDIYSTENIQDNRTTKAKLQKNNRNKELEFDTKDAAVSSNMHLKNDTSKLTQNQVCKLRNLESKAEKTENEYFNRESKLPKRHKLKLTEKETDGKRKVKLHFEEQTKAQKEKIEILQNPKEAVKLGGKVFVAKAKETLSNYGEEATSEENDTRQIVDKTVQVTGKTAYTALNVPKRFINWRTDRKYHKFYKAEQKTANANTKLSYQKYRMESAANHKTDPTNNPKPKTNPVSRTMQKRRFMKEYRKSLAEQSRKVSQSIAQKAVHAVNMISRNFKRLGIFISIIILLILSVGSCMQSVGMSLTGILKGVISSSYPADDAALSEADWYFTDLETGLVDSIEKAEENHPDYDEYNYFLNDVESDMQSLIDAIGHDPFMLLSFLSVMHEDFEFAAIKNDLLEFFNVVYQIQFQTVTETRTRTVVNDDGDEEDEEYTYYILNTRLTVADWETVIQPYIDSKDGGRQYDEYINSGGNHQLFGTPFNFEWYGNISCYYGGRDNPTGANTGSTTASGKEMHTGLDIAAPAGTPIYSIMKGTVTFAGWHDLYGNYLDITDANGNKSRYAHCSRLLVRSGQNVELGEVIAEVGMTGNSTGNHLHLEIFLGVTRVNPIFLVKYKPESEE